MNIFYTDSDPSYRDYYIGEKLTNKNGKLMKWTNVEIPEWIRERR